MTKEVPLSVTDRPAERRTVPRKLATFARLPRFTILWLIPGSALMAVAAGAFAVLPFGVLATCFGAPAGPVAIMPLTTRRDRERALQIAHLVAVLARIVPFRRDCVPQAIVALGLCRLYRVPAALHFGVRWETSDSGARTLQAHAWLASAPGTITGGTSFADYAVTACFVSPHDLLAHSGVAKR